MNYNRVLALLWAMAADYDRPRPVTINTETVYIVEPCR